MRLNSWGAWAGPHFTIGLTMPLPEYRLLPFPQLSLLTLPAAITVLSGVTGFGDLRFVDTAILNAGHSVLWGVGPTLVYPTASLSTTGQGQWQAGLATAIAFARQRWLVGVLAQNPISFAGDRTRPDVNRAEHHPAAPLDPLSGRGLARYLEAAPWPCPPVSPPTVRLI